MKELIVKISEYYVHGSDDQRRMAGELLDIIIDGQAIGSYTQGQHQPQDQDSPS